MSKEYENTAFIPDQPASRRESYQAANGHQRPANDYVEMTSVHTKVSDGNGNSKWNGTVDEAALKSALAAEPLWNSFTVKARDEYYDDADIWFVLRRAAKIVTTILCFLLILFSGVLSKLCFTLITTSTNFTLCSSCTPQERITQNSPAIAWTWALILVICFPYSLNFLKHLWKIISFSRPRWYGLRVLLPAVITESFHSLGVVIFTTLVLPELDMLHCVALFLGLGCIPSFLRMVNKESKKTFRFLRIICNFLSFFGQLTAVIAYPLIQFIVQDEAIDWSIIAYPASLILMSSHWWPNFFDEDTVACESLSNCILSCPIEIPGKVVNVGYKLLISHSSSIVQVVVNFLKILITVVGITLSSYLSNSSEIPYKEFFKYSSADFSPIYVGVISLSCSLVCYYITTHCVKSKFMPVFYTLPLLLITPVCISVLVTLHYVDYLGSAIENSYTTIKFNFLNSDMFGDGFESYWIAFLVVITILSASQFIATFHNWQRSLKSIPSTEVLYLLPMFDAECIDQSLLYNRRPASYSHTLKIKKKKKEADRRLSIETNVEQKEREARDPSTTQLYFCATMWHENEKEMLMMLKSVLRMDFDHFQRRSSQKFTGKIKPDFYNFETHIFFDDAFQPHNNNGGHYTINSYVKQLIQVLPQSIALYYPKLNLTVKDPVKFPTPYGGRLEWDLPSGSRLIVHLKDKMKVRHKKRWSQVMYMYYFLGQQLMNNPHFSAADKEKAARNTYLLALDGDVDFKPEAVLLLVDMMKKNDRVGAACGRIHPIGRGPLIWYQKFEYAIAHWLQKATEHVLGCVLCSPGCFSLFRAEALMQENVMAKYATVSEKATDYLQYDQGEDRWLCTLLLQAGYKVEYNAAADAFTYAPESFDEFFNQRRRWGPSTMANILDLIMDANHVIRTNSDMSLVYVIYQAAQFFASIIGPGTIFMMITGALQVAIKSLSLSDCLIINLIPNLIFVIVSFNVKSSTQLKMAKLLGIIYALVMCLVLISIIIDMASNYCSPTSVFFYTVAGTFIFSAILHPQEISCVLHGVTYYALIPCMYMLLIVFSFININNVSWGTRETVLTPTEQQEAADRAAKAKAMSSKRKSVIDMITSVWKGGSESASTSTETEGTRFACGNVFHCFCCPKPSQQKRNEEYWQINKKLDQLQTLVYERLLPTRTSADDQSSNCVTDSDDSEDGDEARDVFIEQPREKIGHKLSSSSVGRSNSIVSRSHSVRRRPTSLREPSNIIACRDDLVDPFWAEDSDTGDGEIKHLKQEEIEFWTDFIEKLLKPLDKSATHQEKVEMQLKDLRKNVNFAFFLTNTMFITIVYTLQENASKLYLPWPCGKKKGEIDVDPLSVIFLFFFVLVLGIQALGMIVHRLGTFWHIMASTKMRPKKQDSAQQWENIVRMTAQTDDDANDEADEGIESDVDDDNNSVSTDPDEVDPNIFSRNNVVRKSLRATTKKIIKNLSSPVTAVTTLDEALGPKLESLTNGNTDQIENQLRKLSGAQRRKTVRFLKNETTAGGRQRFMSDCRVGRTSSAEDTAGNRRSMADIPVAF